MKNTRRIVKRIGSLTDVLPEIRENDQVKKVYLDTSAFFKVFVEEEKENSDTLERLFELVREKKFLWYYQIG